MTVSTPPAVAATGTGPSAQPSTVIEPSAFDTLGASALSRADVTPHARQRVSLPPHPCNVTLQVPKTKLHQISESLSAQQRGAMLEIKDSKPVGFQKKLPAGYEGLRVGDVLAHVSEASELHANARGFHTPLRTYVEQIAEQFDIARAQSSHMRILFRRDADGRPTAYVEDGQHRLLALMRRHGAEVMLHEIPSEIFEWNEAATPYPQGAISWQPGLAKLFAEIFDDAPPRMRRS